MPRKPHEGAPGSADDKLDDEGRKAIYGASEEETAPEDAERNRQYSGPSAEGKPDSKGSDKRS